MRALQLSTLALLTMAAKADIPDFQYFYSCDSGVVDSRNFEFTMEAPSTTLFRP
jgi:hypothetical protein